MHKILIYWAMIYGAACWSQQFPSSSSSPDSPKKDVDIFGPLFPSGRVPNPRPLPPPPPSPPSSQPDDKPEFPSTSSAEPPSNPANVPSTKSPYPPTQYPKKPIWIPKKPSPSYPTPQRPRYPSTSYPTSSNRPRYPPPTQPSSPQRPRYPPPTQSTSSERPRTPSFTYPTSPNKPRFPSPTYPTTPKKPSFPPSNPTSPKRPNFPSLKYTFSTVNTTTTPFHPVTTKSWTSFSPTSTTPSTSEKVTTSRPRTTSTLRTTRVSRSTVIQKSTPKVSSTTVPSNTFVTSTSLSTTTTFAPKTSSITTLKGTGASRTTVTPAWIYPSRPTWPRRTVHLEQQAEASNQDFVVVENTEKPDPLPGIISEYQSYNEDNGSFSLGFELQNGLSAKVHGYKKNGKQVIEGSYSLFTEDGKPVNIIYEADDINYVEPEPTIFHVDIPINFNFDQNYDTVDPTFSSRNDRIFSVADPQNDEFADLILQPTTEPDDTVELTTETQNE